MYIHRTLDTATLVFYHNKCCCSVALAQANEVTGTLCLVNSLISVALNMSCADHFAQQMLGLTVAIQHETLSASWVTPMLFSIATIVGTTLTAGALQLCPP
eukprot:GHVS01035321.1.p1 GENE.GHVS01035321.1~~GHVS01035321.1.p1  ORF type:complete len:101 (-),score=11.07 GHVS01035321.1:150-452(-)